MHVTTPPLPSPVRHELEGARLSADDFLLHLKDGAPADAGASLQIGGRAALDAVAVWPLEDGRISSDASNLTDFASHAISAGSKLEQAAVAMSTIDIGPSGVPELQEFGRASLANSTADAKRASELLNSTIDAFLKRP